VNGPLLRGPVLWLTGQRWFRALATERGLGRRVAGRFVPGTTLDDAMRAARELDQAGIATMLDYLGENVTSPEQASAAADAYVLALKRIHEAEDLNANISVKLTQVGLDLAYELCMENAERVMTAASEGDTLVMIDMESSEYVDPTLRAHRDLKERYPRVGLALQSCLRRTAVDVHGLPKESIVRLVKGAYLEPPDVAYQTRGEVDGNWARLFATLISGGHTVHVATHDDRLVEGVTAFMERCEVPWARAEFQFLYGIRRDLQQRLAGANHPVRVYVPYGTEWYPYLTRRMAERPANVWFFLSNLIRFRGARGVRG